MKRTIFRSRSFQGLVVFLILSVVVLGTVWINISQAGPTASRSVLIIAGSSDGMCLDGPCGGDNTVVYTDGKT